MDIFRRVAFLHIPSRCRGYAKSKGEIDLTFNDGKEGFKSKYTFELVRAYLVYQICSINYLVENNDKIMKQMQKTLGNSLFEQIMKLTFYGQFVAGADKSTIGPTVKRLAEFGVRSILDYSVEEDLAEEKPKGGPEGAKGDLKKFDAKGTGAERGKTVTAVRTFVYAGEEVCDKNMGHFLNSIEMTHETTKGQGLMALKLTALGKPALLLELSAVIMRARDYMKAMDGKGGNVITHKKTVEDLQRYFADVKDKPAVKEFLAKITTDSKGVIHLFPWSSLIDENLNLSDAFRLPDPKTGQMRKFISQIKPEEEGMFRNMLKRTHQIIEIAKSKNVRVMIDAEQSYFQPAIHRITMELMRKFNKDQFMVWNTYQTYTKIAYGELVADIEQAQRQGFNWAAKLVRGAYMEQERARAKEMGYEDPICPDFDATSASYHKCLEEVIKRTTSGPMKGKCAVMTASHNEDTVRRTVELMRKHNMKPETPLVCFGQLLGMCDHVSFPLGQNGFRAHKYVPYGPVLEVLPYLSRRANENRGFLAKIKKEKRLLLNEIFRRVRSGQMFYVPKGTFKL